MSVWFHKIFNQACKLFYLPTFFLCFYSFFISWHFWCLLFTFLFTSIFWCLLFTFFIFWHFWCLLSTFLFTSIFLVFSFYIFIYRHCFGVFFLLFIYIFWCLLFTFYFLAFFGVFFFVHRFKTRSRQIEPGWVFLYLLFCNFFRKNKFYQIDLICKGILARRRGVSWWRPGSVAGQSAANRRQRRSCRDLVPRPPAPLLALLLLWPCSCKKELRALLLRKSNGCFFSSPLCALRSSRIADIRPSYALGQKLHAGPSPETSFANGNNCEILDKTRKNGKVKVASVRGGVFLAGVWWIWWVEIFLSFHQKYWGPWELIALIDRYLVHRVKY